MTAPLITPLKPCPFCGSAKVETDIGDESACVRCRDCGCQSGRLYYASPDGDGSETVAAAIAAWNRRAAIDAAPAEHAEPEHVATTYTMEALVPGGRVVSHVSLHKQLPAGTKLYTRASASAPDARVDAPTDAWIGKDAVRLDWLMHRLSGKELRRLGIVTSSGGPLWTRVAIDAAMAPSAPQQEQQEGRG